jgi:tetratricopeptide (TPR) repeat protein
MGSSSSATALQLLRKDLAQQKAARTTPLLQKAVEAIKAHRPEKASELALEALQIDERSGIGWHILAIAQEGRGDFVSSLQCYEAALALLPDEPEILINLGRLAFRMNMFETSEKLLRLFLVRSPDHTEGVNNLALSIRAQERLDEAIELLQQFLSRRPTHANIWNSLGSMVGERGDIENAAIFYREALRLDPGIARARYNLGNLWLTVGDAEQAIEEVEAARRSPMAADEKAMMTMTLGLAQLMLGRSPEGWVNYEARHDINFPNGTVFAVSGPRWASGDEIAGKSLLVIGEQGLGDEVLYGSLLPDVIERLGPEGALTLAVEPRLVSLFARSFPGARVEPHKTVETGGRTIRLIPGLEGGGFGIELWVPIGSLVQDLRPTLDSFPRAGGFLKPAPERVEHWRRLLSAAPGPKVGLLWKSAVLAGGRQRFFSPFDAWEPVLRTPGVTFVNLQYGDCEAEIRLAQDRFGVEIWNPPGIDLKQDLDDVTALASALDLVIGFSNATFNLAAGAGVPAWLISASGAWTALGSDRYPWYPQVRLYRPEAFGEWGPVLGKVASDLGGAFPPA